MPTNAAIIFFKHFIEFMHFPIWILKQDKPDLHYKEVAEPLVNLKNSIKEADVRKRGATALLAFHL